MIDSCGIVTDYAKFTRYFKWIKLKANLSVSWKFGKGSNKIGPLIDSCGSNFAEFTINVDLAEEILVFSAEVCWMKS